MHNIHNIYCVGRNYAQHAAELGNVVPDYPMLFLKPSHALTAMNGAVIHLPADQGEIHYEAELVLHIGKVYEQGMRVDELVDQIALGIDLTLRDVQTELKKKGHPWLAAKGFLNSAPLGPFFPFEGERDIKHIDFSLWKNGVKVQRGNITEMIFNLQAVVDYCAAHYGLGPGDLIYTGTPSGVGPISNGDHLLLQWGETPAGECTIALT